MKIWPTAPQAEKARTSLRTAGWDWRKERAELSSEVDEGGMEKEVRMAWGRSGGRSR